MIREHESLCLDLHDLHGLCPSNARCFEGFHDGQVVMQVCQVNTVVSGLEGTFLNGSIVGVEAKAC
jgi:hypothetical protein